MKKLALVILAVFLFSCVAQAGFTPGLKITRMTWKCVGRVDGDPDYLWLAPSGTLQNTSNLTFGLVVIECSIKDTNTGEKVDKKYSAYCENVAPGDKVSWVCDDSICVFSQDAKRNRYVARLDSVKGYTAE